MKYFFLISCVFVISTALSQKATQTNASPIRVYVLKIGTDSISKENLLKEKTMQINNPSLKILRAVAYFHSGVSFKDVQSQQLGTNNLNWITRLKLGN